MNYSGQPHSGFLRQLSPAGTPGLQTPPYALPRNQEVVLGRDPSCQIVLNDTYGGVSRRHAAVRPLSAVSSSGMSPAWEICDLNSANGTYINRQRLQGCQRLQVGDRISLGENGPEFIFEYQISQNTAERSRPATPYAATAAIKPPTPVVGAARGNQPDAVSFTQLFPIISTGRDLTRKAFLIPGTITVGFVVLMFAAVGNPIFFNLLMAAYLAGAAYYFVYQLCGKYKPWWLLVSSAITTILILISPLLMVFIVVFRGILPGSLPAAGESVSFPALLIRMFFGAGLLEELLKALPVLLACFVGSRFRSPWRERIGVWEPLDGILLGAASAVGFTLLETLGQYVPEIVNNVKLQAGEGAGELVGLQLLIPRVLGSVAGHMAYSGYFGYFIGLSVLKPSKRWRILGIGYVSAASLHALWNATGAYSGLILAVVGIVSYAFLAAAILKARALSPTRAQNFATRFFNQP
ncbi:MAG: PrsW family intramembrane metalloprotease [Aphanothece sp. CMT-3BRIN-NPC111]|nr:PrsW family intramembrane metalloprotease [Aphanothece sp. CMT-3BRIN-NPC111]